MSIAHPAVIREAGSWRRNGHDILRVAGNAVPMRRLLLLFVEDARVGRSPGLIDPPSQATPFPPQTLRCMERRVWGGKGYLLTRGGVGRGIRATRASSTPENAAIKPPGTFPQQELRCMQRRAFQRSQSGPG